MSLLAPILGGLLVGFLVLRLANKKAQDKLVETGDGLLLAYMIPALLFLMGTRFLLSTESLRVTGLMAAAMTLSFFIGLFIASKVLRLNTEMRNGFLVLSSCTNTGHGVMLLAASTAASDIVGLAMGPMYVGFLAVVFLPMMLVNSAGLKSIMPNMVLWHPVSYYMLTGVLYSHSPLLAFGWFALIGARLWKVHNHHQAMNTAPKPYYLLAGLLASTLLFSDALPYKNLAQLLPIVMVLLTSITIGIKMGTPMTIKHWKIVAWINVFGIVIAPTVGLILAKLVDCSYEEAYVLTYSLSQPPAYLGMLWLRQGKFGKDFAISEWAFVIQALLAYAWAIFAPHLLRGIF